MEQYIYDKSDGCYTSLLVGRKLNRYLADIAKRAEEMFNILFKYFKNTEGITERLKAQDQMEWVAKINNIRQRATEIVNNELIYN